MTKNERWACVTGSAKRIGAEVSLRLAQEGYNIILHYNKSKDDALELSETIESLNCKTLLFQGDLLDSAFPEALFKFLGEKIITLDVLVNSASVFGLDTLETITEQSFQNNITVNLRAPLFLCQNYMKTFSRGHIINFLDRAITTHKKDQLSYLLSKKSLADLTESLARFYGPNFQINAIAPGWILQPINQDQDKEQTPEVLGRIPLGRKGETSDIAQAVMSILSLNYTTGQIIYVDGGKHLL